MPAQGGDLAIQHIEPRFPHAILQRGPAFVVVKAVLAGFACQVTAGPARIAKDQVLLVRAFNLLEGDLFGFVGFVVDIHVMLQVGWC